MTSSLLGAGASLPLTCANPLLERRSALERSAWSPLVSRLAASTCIRGGLICHHPDRPGHTLDTGRCHRLTPPYLERIAATQQRSGIAAMQRAAPFFSGRASLSHPPAPS